MLVIAPLDRNRKGSIYYLLRGSILEHEMLTETEMKILQLIRMGSSNERIAQMLRRTEGTVKKHLQQIYSKLGVESRLDAAYHAPGEWVLP